MGVLALCLAPVVQAARLTPSQYAQVLCADIRAAEPASYKLFEHVLRCSPGLVVRGQQLYNVWVEVDHRGIGTLYRALTYPDGHIAGLVVVSRAPVA